jgi:hypothetical protein
MAKTGIFRYVRLKASRNMGRGMVLGTVMKAGEINMCYDMGY